MKTMPRVGDAERAYTKEFLDSDFHLVPGSNMCARLESAFAKKFGTEFAITHVNGTATLHSCLAAAGVGPGDEVIVPPLTMASTSLAVLHQNAIPMFADVDPETFQIDPESIRALISPRTKAIITVALYGLSPDMDPIMEMAKEHGIPVIEDDAQCFLGWYKGKLVGTIGDMSSFSFQRTKHMTSGEGGMVITNNEKYADAIRSFACLGYGQYSGKKIEFSRRDIMNPNVDRHVALGWNYLMPKGCAAIALGQLERLDEFVTQRQEIAKAYEEIVSRCSWLVPQRIPADCVTSSWSYVVRLERDDITWEQFFDAFVSHGGDGFYAAWKLTYMEPMFQHMRMGGREIFFEQPFFTGKKQEYKAGLCPIAERLQKKLIQFKTSCMDAERFQKQLDALEKAIAQFS
ncbi:MAG: DegT/DnrJ/EryC1/StrS family aminotransferase [Patescibacteria group bacterium]